MTTSKLDDDIKRLATKMDRLGETISTVTPEQMRAVLEENLRLLDTALQLYPNHPLIPELRRAAAKLEHWEETMATLDDPEKDD